MTTMTEASVTTQVYQVFIKASPEAIWDAITTPEWTQKYGWRSPAEFDLRPGGAYRGLASEAMLARGAPEVVVDGEVIEADRPRKLVQTVRSIWDSEGVAEGFTRLTWEIEETDGGVAKLTVSHELEGAPKMAAVVAGEDPNAGGGWSWVLSDLKTLLETGKPLKRAIASHKTAG